jgi:fibrillarin-like rRNA methylase
VSSLQSISAVSVRYHEIPQPCQESVVHDNGNMYYHSRCTHLVHSKVIDSSEMIDKINRINS